MRRVHTAPPPGSDLVLSAEKQSPMTGIYAFRNVRGSRFILVRPGHSLRWMHYSEPLEGCQQKPCDRWFGYVYEAVRAAEERGFKVYHFASMQEFRDHWQDMERGKADLRPPCPHGTLRDRDC